MIATNEVDIKNTLNEISDKLEEIEERIEPIQMLYKIATSMKFLEAKINAIVENQRIQIGALKELV